tara:strand:+ start:124 stop:249 length:126 start_codon:yes stop_codon:yes gene_type:complete
MATCGLQEDKRELLKLIAKYPFEQLAPRSPPIDRLKQDPLT